MSHHLQPVRDPTPEGSDEVGQLRRPSWWRWIAIAVVLALVVATPFAYLLSYLLR